jgi:hypothetical protein
MLQERARLAGLTRHHPDPDHPAVVQARRALALAMAEHRIREAIDAAPPLDAATLARIRALIPPAPARST